MVQFQEETKRVIRHLRRQLITLIDKVKSPEVLKSTISEYLDHLILHGPIFLEKEDMLGPKNVEKKKLPHILEELLVYPLTACDSRSKCRTAPNNPVINAAELNRYTIPEDKDLHGIHIPAGSEVVELPSTKPHIKDFFFLDGNVRHFVSIDERPVNARSPNSRLTFHNTCPVLTAINNYRNRVDNENWQQFEDGFAQDEEATRNGFNHVHPPPQPCNHPHVEPQIQPPQHLTDSGFSNFPANSNVCPNSVPVPVSVPDPNICSDPAPDSNICPNPALNQNIRPTPAPNQNIRPAPAPNQNVCPTPAPYQNIRPVPAPNQNICPAPTPNQNECPAQAPSQNICPAPASNQNICPAPAPASNQNECPNPNLGTQEAEVISACDQEGQRNLPLGRRLVLPQDPDQMKEILDRKLIAYQDKKRKLIERLELVRKYFELEKVDERSYEAALQDLSFEIPVEMKEAYKRPKRLGYNDDSWPEPSLSLPDADEHERLLAAQRERQRCAIQNIKLKEEEELEQFYNKHWDPVVLQAREYAIRSEEQRLKFNDAIGAPLLANEELERQQIRRQREEKAREELLQFREKLAKERLEVERVVKEQTEREYYQKFEPPYDNLSPRPSFQLKTRAYEPPYDTDREEVSHESQFLKEIHHRYIPPQNYHDNQNENNKCPLPLENKQDKSQVRERSIPHFNTLESFHDNQNENNECPLPQENKQDESQVRERSIPHFNTLESYHDDQNENKERPLPPENKQDNIQVRERSIPSENRQNKDKDEEGRLQRKSGGKRRVKSPLTSRRRKSSGSSQLSRKIKKNIKTT